MSDGNKGTPRLIRDLRALEPSPARDALLALAQRDAFHDFRSESPTPKVFLHTALTKAGFTALAARVVDGDYDDQPTAEDLAELRALIGPEAFDAMQGRDEN